jgi:hypothetical protein
MSAAARRGEKLCAASAFKASILVKKEKFTEHRTLIIVNR